MARIDVKGTYFRKTHRHRIHTQRLPVSVGLSTLNCGNKGMVSDSQKVVRWWWDGGGMVVVWVKERKRASCASVLVYKRESSTK